MDRQVIYPGQVPLETDLLKTNQNVMVGLAKVCEALFGTAGVAVGFGTTQTVVPSLAVLVAPGEVYMQQNLESSAISSLPQDLAHSIVKQGIALDAQTLALTAPGTAGFSVNYLVQVGYQDTDSGSAVLPYYNASNPSIAYSGPANSGAAQPTIRQGSAVVSLKAGTAATTGTQATPAPDAGKLGLFVITVANGATTVVNANISSYAGAPLAVTPLMSGRLINVRVFTSSGTYVPTPGTKAVRVTLQGGGGAGGGAPATAAGTVGVGAGGTAGAYAVAFLTTGFLGAAMVVGAAGTGNSGLVGNAGGATSFGGAGFLAGGGQGGGAVGPAAAPLIAGNNATAGATGGYLNLLSNMGGSGSMLSGTTGLSGAGANSPLGGGGGPANGSSNGIAGSGYGAGGGGAIANNSSVARVGGFGAPGVIIVEEFA